MHITVHLHVNMGTCLNRNRAIYITIFTLGLGFVMTKYIVACYGKRSFPFPSFRIGKSVPKLDLIFKSKQMGGASYRLGIRICACTGASLWLAHRTSLYVSCREKRRLMASAPDVSGATAELQQLKVQDEDYNPFTEEGKIYKRLDFPVFREGIWQSVKA